MLKNIFLLVIIIPFQIVFSQNTINGKTINTTNNYPIQQVEIINIQTHKKTYSDDFGNFNIVGIGTYSFKALGYQTKTIVIKKPSFLIIELKEQASALQKIVLKTKTTNNKTTTSSIGISKKEIERGNSTNPASIINRVPGVFMQSGSLNTNRITIRGIGSRNLFGTAKIRAYFNNIPLTNGSGETNIEDFELNSLSKIEIKKGGDSSIYGAGLGGTILLIPEISDNNSKNISAEFSVGSFDFIKNNMSLNIDLNKNSIKAIYSNTHSGGYRENNNYNRQTLTFNTNHKINSKNSLSVLSSYVDLKAFIPSSVDENTYNINPKSAAYTWKATKGYEDSKRGILGFTWNHQFYENFKQSTSLFSLYRDSYEPRPFNILTETSTTIGLRSFFNVSNTLLFNKKLDWSFGGELFNEIYQSDTFENLYENYPQGTGSVKGNQLSNFKENRYYYNLFTNINYQIFYKTMLSAGFNINKTFYQLHDRFQASVNNPNQSGNYNFKTIVSPKIGISYLATKNINFYTNLSHGFSPISLNETLLPNGQINNKLQPETGWTYELGTKANLLNNRLQVHATIFSMNIKNLLVSRRTEEDEYIGVNAGSTKNNGLETTINYKIINNKSINFNSYISYTLNKFKFVDFVDDNNNYSNNKLTGVPSDVFNAVLDLSTFIGFYGNINYQHVGSMPITDSNSLFSNSYHVTNLKIGYLKKFNEKINFKIFLGINNIFKEHYASQILINATGFGGGSPRYYYPGPPLNYFTGIHINYNL